MGRRGDGIEKAALAWCRVVMEISDLICRPAKIDEIYELRFAVLRPKEVPMKLHFPGDGDGPPKTWHFGAFAGGEFKPVGCLTLLASTWEGRPAMQLRG